MKTNILALRSTWLSLLLLGGTFLPGVRAASPNVEGMVQTESIFRSGEASKQEAEKLLERHR
jgi:hypothetical protein